ncbi:hypothetical protein N7526_004836 [Penicillium atrosanguineum]|nr:hypothetical protein N7526_004836 [Penicillium atrosanguineum]
MFLRTSASADGSWLSAGVSIKGMNPSRLLRVSRSLTWPETETLLDASYGGISIIISIIGSEVEITGSPKIHRASG